MSFYSYVQVPKTSLKVRKVINRQAMWHRGDSRCPPLWCKDPRHPKEAGERWHHWQRKPEVCDSSRWRPVRALHKVQHLHGKHSQAVARGGSCQPDCYWALEWWMARGLELPSSPPLTLHTLGLRSPEHRRTLRRGPSESVNFYDPGSIKTPGTNFWERSCRKWWPKSHGYFITQMQSPR